VARDNGGSAMNNLTNYLFVGMGGFIGANARFIVARWAADRWGTGFPWGTFIINIVGCLILGLFMTLADKLAWSDAWRFTIAIGFVGAFTTFSTYEYESFKLVADGQLVRAAANIIGSVIVGFAGVCVGVVLARLLLRMHA
jgi:fluoride exporter